MFILFFKGWAVLLDPFCFYQICQLLDSKSFSVAQKFVDKHAVNHDEIIFWDGCCKINRLFIPPLLQAYT